MLVSTKSILKSKTFWLAIAAAILSLADVVDMLDLPAAESVLGILAPLLVVLRYYTSQPVTVRGTPKKDHRTGRSEP